MSEPPASSEQPVGPATAIVMLVMAALLVVGTVYALGKGFSFVFGRQGSTPVATRSDAVETISAVPGVIHVERRGGDLLVQAKIEADDVSAYVPEMLDVAKGVSEALRAAGSQKAGGEVVIDFAGPTVDRLGNDGTDPLLKMWFPEADLAGASFGNLLPGRQADLARSHVIESGAGADAIHAFCAGQLGAASQTFCLQAP